jgi:hypothetical protein
MIALPTLAYSQPCGRHFRIAAAETIEGSSGTPA